MKNVQVQCECTHSASAMCRNMLTIGMDSGCKHSKTGLNMRKRGTAVLRCGHLSDGHQKNRSA